MRAKIDSLAMTIKDIEPQNCEFEKDNCYAHGGNISARDVKRHAKEKINVFLTSLPFCSI